MVNAVKLARLIKPVILSGVRCREGPVQPARGTSVLRRANGARLRMTNLLLMTNHL